MLIEHEFFNQTLLINVFGKESYFKWIAGIQEKQLHQSLFHVRISSFSGYSSLLSFQTSITEYMGK